MAFYQCGKYTCYPTSLVKSYLGISDAQLLLGQIYLYGDVYVDKDNQEALKWIGKSIENGNNDALHFMVGIHLNGKGVPKNEKEALKWMELGAQRNLAWAAHSAGFSYQKGLGVEKDCVKAKQYYMQAYNLGEKKAAKYIQEIYRPEVCGSRDDAELFKWTKITVDQGNSGYFSALAGMYMAGTGVAKNEAEGIKWYLKSAEANDPQAMIRLSYYYREGMHVEKDLQKSEQLALQAYDAGSKKAAAEQLIMLSSIYGVAGDILSAKRLAQEAARSGDTFAVFYLAALLSHGDNRPWAYQSVPEFYNYLDKEKFGLQ